MLTSIRTALAGRYVLERELGRGSMASVYAARDLKHGRRVALKVIESEVVSTLGTHRFLQEIRTTAGLNHPHILPLFESGEADGFIYYTMPLVEGECLRHRIEKQGRLPLHAALPLIRQVASALSYAHSVGIVHRDIKPENILVGERDHVWVADFGLARALATAVDQRLTGEAMAIGSPQYMSPEQAAGESDADARSDIYSLGCMAFELLCGEPPFTATSVPALLARHLSEPAPSIRDRCADVPAHVDAALRRALAKDRSHRFADAEALAAAMEAGAAETPDPVGPPAPRPAPARRRSRRTRSAGPATVGTRTSARDRFSPARAVHGLRSLFRELKRRKVIGVLVAYSVAAAGVMQVIDIVAPRMNMPENTVNLVILLALAGLPVAAVLAWLYDLVPDARRSGQHVSTPVEPAHPVAEDAAGRPVPDRSKEVTAPWHAAALPTAATPFIGRADELRELRELLCDSGARLVTVTGPGGVGKTRLALHIAEQIARNYRDGVAYRALSGLAAPDLLVPALADSLGIPLSRREDPLIELKAFLREKELLLVLDNFEHLTSAAGLLSALLDDAPGVQLLVTTRERLNLRYERLVALDGLLLTGGDDASDAVQLFAAGARRLDSHFRISTDNRAAIERICELLGGVPLAIELASSWVRALSCAEILSELEHDLDVLSSDAPDLEERHHSLRATFDASWRLLSAPEQSALARLAVFRSTFDRAAAGQVADAGAPMLRQLVDKSLLTRAGERLLMLDVVRAFALERLRADPEMERRAYERHLACLATLLHTLRHRVQRADAGAIQRIADSIDDIRAAWDYATQTNNTVALLRAMDGLFHFYDSRGWAREGAEVFARTRAVAGDFSSQHDVPRAKRLAAAQLDVRHGVFLHRLGDLQPAESLLRRGLAVARELEDSPEIVFALHRLGAVLHGMGDYTESERLHEEAWLLAQQVGDRLAVGWSMTYLGNVAWSRGEFDTAARQYMAALELLREEHDANGMWVTLNNLGVLAASREQYEEAQRRFRESLALQSELKNPRFSAQALHNLGNAAVELGDFALARQSLEESLEMSDRMGYQSMAAMSHVGLAQLAMREDDMSGADAALQCALGMARAARNHPLALEALVTLARLRLQQGDTHGAAELAAAVARHPGSDRDVLRKAAELFEEIGGELPPPDATVDLDGFIDRITGRRPATTITGAAAVARRQRMHAQPAGDT